MGRMRVHELAKELNMNNKDLLDRILKMGIEAKNHMSTLTDAAVQKIRQQFSEAKAEKVEEKRIGRAVIRRRKTASAEEVPGPEGVAEETAPVPPLTAEEVVGVPAESPVEVSAPAPEARICRLRSAS